MKFVISYQQSWDLVIALSTVSFGEPSRQSVTDCGLDDQGSIPDRFWGIPSLLSNLYRGYLPRPFNSAAIKVVSNPIYIQCIVNWHQFVDCGISLLLILVEWPYMINTITHLIFRAPCVTLLGMIQCASFHIVFMMWCGRNFYSLAYL